MFINMKKSIQKLKHRYKVSQKPDTPVLVYQMGKVGSNSLVHSINKASNSQSAVHIHYLSEQGAEILIDYYTCLFGSNSVHIQNYKAQREIILKSKRKKIISLIREPIAREISFLFEFLEQLKTFPKNNYATDNSILAQHSVLRNTTTKFSDLMDSDLSVSIPKIRNHLLQRFSVFDATTEDYCTWFDRELKTITGVDIFEHSFDKEKGFQVIQTENSDILLLSLEKLNSTESEIAKFVGIDKSNFSLITKNIATDKSLSDTYKKITSGFKIPLDVANNVYQSRECKHFYTDESITNFIHRWT
jgi:hypothetical protein